LYELDIHRILIITEYQCPKKEKMHPS